MNGDYSNCNREMCTSYTPIPKEQLLHSENKNFCKYLRLAYDTVCNIACKTCRDDIKVIFTDKKKELTEKIIPILDSIEIIQLSTAGDVFASKNGIDF